METHARPPAPLRKDGDMASNWQNWKEEFLIFMKITNYMERESSDKRACRLKNLIGTVGIEAIRNITFDNEQDKDDMDILIEKIDKYFIPTKKEVVERHQFFTTSKKQNESIEHHVTLLREKAKNCNFKDLTDSIIRDKIILDTHDKILRQKFLEADDLNLKKLMAIYNDYTNTEQKKQFIQFPCWRCGTKHPKGQCPAWGSKCKDCNELHHYTGRCPDPKKNKKNNDKANKNVFDETQKFTPKNNDKWNNRPNSTIKKDSITFPDVPTACDSDNENASVDKDFTFNFPKNKHDLQFWNDNTTNHSANLPKKTQESCSYKKFPIKSDETHTTNSKLQNDIMNHSANLPKKTEESCSYKFPVKPNGTHKRTEDSHSHKNFAVKPGETHANSKLNDTTASHSANFFKSTLKPDETHANSKLNDTTAGHSANLFKSTLKPDETRANSKLNDTTTGHSTNLSKSTRKPDETHNTNSRSWYDNAMNHPTNSSQSTQVSHSYKNFATKPDGTHNTSSKLWNDNNTTHSTYLPNTQHGQLQFARHAVDASDGWTILHKGNLSKNENIQKKKTDKDCVVS